MGMTRFTNQLMNYKRKIIVSALLVALCSSKAFAQVNYQQQYTSGKAFFKDGKYNLAMEAFKSIVVYDKDNPFSEYASYYYALSAYNQGYKSVAKDMLLQLKQLYPSWDQIDEANLWLAKIHFDNHEYFQGIRVLGTVKNNKLRKEVRLLQRSAVDSISDVETLKTLLQTYPEDEIIGKQYARILSQNLALEENRQQLQIMIERFKLKQSDYIEEAPKSFFKDRYAVSVLFPFVVNTLDPSPTRKRNQFVLDLYQGMKQAVDTLLVMGVRIDLRAYDTERSVKKTEAILDREELRSSDLIVSPLFSEMNGLVQDFSHQNKINAFNPVSNNSEIIKGNPFGFLFQPSNEILGRQSADFLASRKGMKNCIVFYGESLQDSVMAANFIVQAMEKGLKIRMAPMITKGNTKKILDLLQTPTEFDEFKYPIQFTLPKDSVDCIFVASTDPLVYAKVISSVETRRDSIMVVGSESWLDQQSIEYEKYESLGVVLFAPTFTKFSNPWYKAFQKGFLRIHGRVSSTMPYTNYAKVGYEFMLFIGNAFKDYGVYFQEGLDKNVISPGFLSQGYDFRGSQINQFVPFIRVNQGAWEVIDTENSNELKSKK
jgi:tetratricopeptide (TPR) repeat protein